MYLCVAFLFRLPSPFPRGSCQGSRKSLLLWERGAIGSQAQSFPLAGKQAKDANCDELRGLNQSVNVPYINQGRIYNENWIICGVQAIS